ncbi:MAG TPA: Nramp family divalent metal transporter [Terriglobales bacterium]|nr:Nramp family divalent metal transporter [Terriglobales bacterium]
MNEDTLQQTIITDTRPTRREAQAGRQSNRLKSVLRLLGPGLITGAANDDPSAIGTYAKAGAAFGFSALWMAPLVFPMMAASMFLCSKLGMVSGMGIAGVLRRYYSPRLLYPVVICLVIANIIEAAADLGAIAASIRLIIPVPLTVIILGVTGLILGLQTWGSYAMLQRIFKWLALALLSYVGAAFLAKPALAEVIRGTFIPDLHLDSSHLAMLVAVVGTTMSPYLFFWQSSQSVEEKTANGHHHPERRAGAAKQELRFAAMDAAIGMLFSSLMMYFIILCTAATLFKTGHVSVDSAGAAAEALRPLAGNAASLLFATGVVGVGILAVPVLTTGAGYALAETFGWRHGLVHKPGHAPEFYAVIALSTCVAVAIGFSGINPISALFFAAIIMGLLAPPLMIIIMLITNNRRIMGDRVNGRAVNILGWITTIVVSAASLGLMWSWLG